MSLAGGQDGSTLDERISPGSTPQPAQILLHPVGHRVQLVRVGDVVDGDDAAVGVEVDGEGGDDAAGAADHDARPAVDLDDFGCHVGDFDALVGSVDDARDPPGDVRRADDRTHRLADLAAAVGPQRDVRRE